MHKKNLKNCFDGLVCNGNNTIKEKINNITITPDSKDNISIVTVEFRTQEKTSEITFTEEQFLKFISECVSFSNAFIHGK